MLGALIYLRLTTLRGRLTATARRLRQPKYFGFFLVGVGYLYFAFLRQGRLLGPWEQSGNPALAQRISADALTALGGAVLLVVLLAIAVFTWLSAGPGARLKFSEAEIAFLFPAPLSRRRLVHFQLLGSQLSILLSAFILTAVLNRWSFLPGTPLTHAFGWWLILSTVRLFSNAMNFGAAKLIGLGGPGLRRRALAFLALVALALGRSLWLHAPAAAAGSVASLGALAGTLAAWCNAAFGPVLLRPFSWVVGPFVAESARAFLLALGPGLVLPVACYLTVVRLEVPFAEGSIAGAEKGAQARATRRRDTPRFKPRPAPFPLIGAGRPEAAFFWKNLIAIQSWFNLRLFVVLIALAALFVAANRPGPAAPGSAYAPMVFIASLFLAFYCALLGPQIVRQDLRGDLPNADILKTYPLPGWQIVVGEMLTPILLLSGVLWVLAIAASWAIFAGFGPAAHFGLVTRITFLVCIGAAIPPLVCLQLLVPNGAALLFPAWQNTLRGRSVGVESIGQRLIFVVGQMLAVVVALLPAAVLAGLVPLAVYYYWADLAHWRGGEPAALISGTAAGVAVLGGEIWVGLWWLGRRFEQLDVAADLRT